MKTDTIELMFEVLDGSKFREIDGIMMNDCFLVEAIINGSKLLGEEFFEDGLIVFEELEKSTGENGEFLIFTCACGIADDGGWGMTSVRDEESKVKWIVRRGDDEKEYLFDKQNYLNSINQLKTEFNQLQQKGLRQEPVNPIPPESPGSESSQGSDPMQ